MAAKKTKNDNVKVVLSHQQVVDGKERKAGEEITLPSRVAKALASRGSVQIPGGNAGPRTAPTGPSVKTDAAEAAKTGGKR